jgi:hypothetical protein
MAAIVGARALPGAGASVFVALAAIGTYVLVARETRRPSDPRVISVAIGLVLVTAVLAPDHFSGDVWAYSMIGRTLAHYHHNPYHVPAVAFRHDVFFRHVARGDRHGTTPYGPAFVATAGIVAVAVGTHVLLARIAFQLIAALAVALAAWLVWRATRSTAALALVGLHPVVAASVVNGGHNDALVGLGILAAALLLARDRPLAAGASVAAATLVKVTGGLALVPLAAWAAVRKGWRDALAVVAPTALVAAPVMLLTPGALASVSGADHGLISRASPWNIAYMLIGNARHLSMHHPIPTVVLTRYGLYLVVALVIMAALVTARNGSPGRAAAFGTAAWLCAAPYFLPFYAAWSLPAAALTPRAPISRLLAIQAGVLVTLYELRVPMRLDGHGLAAVFTLILPGVILAAFVGAVCLTALRGRASPAVEISASTPS